MRIGIAQLDIIWEDPAANRRNIESLLGQTQNLGGLDWLVFPEAALTGFTLNVQASAPSKEDLDYFASLAQALNCYVSYGAFINSANRLLTLNRKGKPVSSYAKHHPFSLRGEGEVYPAGTRQASFKLQGARVRPSICYDLRFSNLYWPYALSTDIYLVAASWPCLRKEHWRTLLAARAIENQAFVIGVNRCGEDPFASYCGDSRIISPNGETILDCGSGEGIYLGELDPRQVKVTREAFPALADR